MNGLETVGFVILATLALASATVVVFHRSPVVSALALAFNLVRDQGANVIATMERVKSTLAELEAGPIAAANLEIEQVYDETIYIRGAIDLVIGSEPLLIEIPTLEDLIGEPIENVNLDLWTAWGDDQSCSCGCMPATCCTMDLPRRTRTAAHSTSGSWV